MNTVDWSTPHPLVTAEYRAGIEAHKATQNALDLVRWEREMANLPADGVTYVVEGESRV
jgi:hypothetical protein